MNPKICSAHTHKRKISSDAYRKGRRGPHHTLGHHFFSRSKSNRPLPRHLQDWISPAPPGKTNLPKGAGRRGLGRKPEGAAAPAIAWLQKETKKPLQVAEAVSCLLWCSQTALQGCSGRGARAAAVAARSQLEKEQGGTKRERGERRSKSWSPLFCISGLSSPFSVAFDGERN